MKRQSESRQMTGANMVVQALIDHGVTDIFGYPGGSVLPIYDEIIQQDAMRHILVRHEQGAGHAAEGYARSTGRPGVVLVTSGPGATNMVTPLTDALMDFRPDGVHHRPGADPPHRQRRLSGSRHGRHHAPLHQAQLAGPRRQRSRPRPARSLLRRHPRPARARCWSTSPRTCSSPPAPTFRPARSRTRPTIRAWMATSAPSMPRSS